MISIIDYKVCNLSSIQNMLRQVNINAKIINTPKEVLDSDYIILPGVGNFETGIKNLIHKGLDKALIEANANKIKIIGICLGMQLLFEESDESNLKGLGLIPGKVKKFNFQDENLKIPHMGWNYVNIKKNSRFYFESEKKTKFYFAHSYYVECKDRPYEVGITNYGQNFCSIIENSNIFGVQFHPEKSHNFGKQLFRTFFK